jgi:hypothetical protein
VKLESRPNHEAIGGAADSISLLENIRAVMFHFQSQRYNPLALHEAKHRFYLYSQDRQMSCQAYHEAFKNNVEVIEYCGGVLGTDTALVDSELDAAGTTRATATAVELQDAENAARERVLACAFLVGSDRTRYGKLLEDLENSYTQGSNNYPATLQSAYSLLVHWKQDPRNITRLIGDTTDGVAFANVAAEGSHGDGTTRNNTRRCYNCGEVGHISRDCPDTAANGNGGSSGGDTGPTQLHIQGVEELVVEDS